MGVLLAGLWRRSGQMNEYLIAGRKLSLPAFVLSIVSAWYGGILGVSEYSYTYGLSNWFVFGVPYYLYALIFALFLAKRARRSELLSLPDRFQMAYGTNAARLCGGIIFLTAMPAAYLLMLGKLIEWMFGLPYHVSLLIGAAISTLYLFRGGLFSVIRTDMIQFALMYIGFAVMVVTLYLKYGGIEFVRASVAPELLTPTGGQAISAVLVWYVIASTTLVEPLFYERSFAAKSDKTVIPGVVIAVLFWAVFDLALLAWFSKKPPNENATIVSMLLAGGIALVWRLSGFWTGNGSYWLGVEPIFVGLAVSALVLPQRLEADNDECGMMNNELGQNLEALLCGDVGAICADPV
ncbi:MAG: hypothetical protein IPP40_03425 [bacterium]|nr:hypothetical protein [bacterium]